MLLSFAITSEGRQFCQKTLSAFLTVVGLLDAPVDWRKREILEKRIIFKLDTRVPNGLNKQFSFFWFD